MSVPDSVEWGAVLLGVALLPFVAIMVTAFVKISVVLAILRRAIGFASVPSAQVIVGLSLVLTAFVMAPVGDAMHGAAIAAWTASAETEEGPRLAEAGVAAAAPLLTFLGTHAHEADRDLFVSLSAGRGDGATLSEDHALVLIPAFVLSELSEAFLIGVLLFLPFLVIDLACAVLLGAVGLQTLSTTVVSLPFKLLLFVLVDGWYLIVRGLVESYQVAGL